MPKEQTLARVDKEIAEGKLGIARDRLHGLVIAYPCDIALRSRLGDVYAKLGYPVYAGRFWYLDRDTFGEKEEAVKAFTTSCGKNPQVILERLKISCEPSQLSDPVAANKIESLVEECRARGLRPPPPRTSNRPKSFCDRFLWSFCLVIVAALMILMAIGLGTVITWLEQTFF